MFTKEGREDWEEGGLAGGRAGRREGGLKGVHGDPCVPLKGVHVGPRRGGHL